ncbi:MAG: hypothetical protein ACLGIV_01850 [Actinomycetes bacterium]
MYARTTEFTGGSGRLDAGLAFVREEVLPTVTAIDGCIGLSCLADRSSGRCIATSAWTTQEAMRASDARIEPLRRRGSEIFGGMPRVQEWEIAALHRDHQAPDGACARVTWLRAGAEGIAEAVDVFRMVTLPKLDHIGGFVSASLLVDRDGGIGAASTVWENREAMVASRAEADRLRQQVKDESRGEIIEVAEFELVLAHLHVPEMV